MAVETQQPDVYIRWRDLNAVEKQLRDEFGSECKELETSVKERFDRAHTFYSDAVGDQMKLIEDVDRRLDRVESVLDQQSGAWTLAKFLIGSNLALTIVGVLTLLVLFTTT